jgi:hypothetical protein
MQAVARSLVSLYLRRKRREARRILARTTAQPERCQQEVLRQILAVNAPSTFGREHRFEKIATIREFQDAVQIHGYEELRPYVDRIADGSDPHALTAEPVEMFTSTSGTTSQPKLIPVTASGRRAERRVKEAWLAHLVADHPSTLSGKGFLLYNKAEEYKTPSGLWVGSNAGLLARNTPSLIRSLRAVPYEFCLIDEYESRYYVLLRHLLACDLSLLACINPSSILLLAELIQQHAEALIKDIYTGGLRRGLALTEEQYAFFRARLPAKPERAKELARQLARDGRLLPACYWPRLRVLNSWKGPAVHSFIEKCREWYGDLPFRDVGYGSSEFRTGLVLSDEGSRNILMPDSYFYEFIPEADRETYLSGSKRPLLLHELEQGRQYRIVQTGPHGLYRYDIDDIVEVNGAHGRTPTIQFVQKGKMVTSITGEKLYEAHVIEAMERIAARRPELKPAFFICYADVDAANYKLCVEYDESRSPERLQELLRLFDETLGEVNIEYSSKRASLRLQAPEIFPLCLGASVRLIQQLGKHARMDNQVKIPRLSRDINTHFQFFGLERKTLHA